MADNDCAIRGDPVTASPTDPVRLEALIAHPPPQVAAVDHGGGEYDQGTSPPHFTLVKPSLDTCQALDCQDDFQVFVQGVNAASTPVIGDRHPHTETGGAVNPILLADDRRALWPTPTALAREYPSIAEVYNTVKETGLPNSQGAKIMIPTGLNTAFWKRIATGHPNDPVVLDGVCYGFNLQYCGPPLPTKDGIVNHQSATAFYSQVQSYIRVELEHGAILGPFSEPPFSWVHISPMMTRPKASADLQARRVIVDLSFPREHNINMGIPHNTIFGVPYSHTLPTVDDLVALCELAHYEGYLYSVDISRAYRNFPVDPIDWPMMAITHDQHILLDLAMPFGARSSSLNMQLVANFIQRYLHLQGASTLMYLDDLIGHALTLEDATAHYHLVQDVMGSLGLPLAVKKLTAPTRTITWLGIVLDLDHKTLTIPRTKIVQILADMSELYRKPAMCRRDVQRLAGRINHLAKACRPARLFMARILAYLRGHPPGYTKVPPGVKADIKWFTDFLPDFNGVSTIPPPRPLFTIEADSCLQGGGGLGDGRCYMYTYPPDFADAHISQLEGVNCMAAIRLLVGPAHRGSTILIHCDNSAAVSIFATGKGREPVILACARAIWRHAAELDCFFIFRHRPGVLMEAADALSRAGICPKKKAEADRIIRQRGLTVVSADYNAFDYSAFM